MPESRDAKLLQVFSRQVRQDRLVNLVFAEGPFVPFEAKAPQPNSEVHEGALTPRPKPYRQGALSKAKSYDYSEGFTGFLKVGVGGRRLKFTLQEDPFAPQGRWWPRRPRASPEGITAHSRTVLRIAQCIRWIRDAVSKTASKAQGQSRPMMRENSKTTTTKLIATSPRRYSCLATIENAVSKSK